LGECLGKGAYGSVFRGFNTQTGESVAVKRIKLKALSPSDTERLMDEVTILKRVRHPNIVCFYNYHLDARYLHIFLEYCEGSSLEALYRKFGVMAEPLATRYIVQILEGLCFIHDRGIIHKDVKASNILTTKDGSIKLADFGASSEANRPDQSTIGSPYWMAPEVIHLQNVDFASDVWSLGCTVLELLQARPPYADLSPVQALFRMVNDLHPPFPEKMSDAGDDFLRRCLQQDPKHRYPVRRLLQHSWLTSARRKVGERGSGVYLQYF
ncbi:kinase-like domain-containing protein, partial [Piptocephalis cylindrospora]